LEKSQRRERVVPKEELCFTKTTPYSLLNTQDQGTFLSRRGAGLSRGGKEEDHEVKGMRKRGYEEKG